MDIAQATGLGRQDFLRLLTTQLRYQNPLEPVKETEFVAQLAQFSALEATLDLQKAVNQVESRLAAQADDLALSLGLGLIGRQVSGLFADGSRWSGVPVRLTIRDGAVWLGLTDGEVPLESVDQVSEAP